MKISGITVDFEAVADEPTILKFRHLLEWHTLGMLLFDEMVAVSCGLGRLVRQATIGDAKVIAGMTQTRGPEMSKPRRPATGIFDIEVPIAVDVQSGSVYLVEMTSASVDDLAVNGALPHGQDDIV